METRHLLLALWLDESRAAEILQKRGITPETLGLERIAPAESGPDGADVDAGGAVDRPQLSPTLTAALAEAHTAAGQGGRHVETGTEHLLLGLFDVDEDLGQALAEAGLTRIRLQQEVIEQTGFSHAPIATDIELVPVVRAPRQTTDVDRILDAAANRCREGLRVVEDFVRFVLDDAHLSRLLKEHRHALAATLAQLPQDRMLASRDTRGDVGTGIATDAERHRAHVFDVVRASCKRVEESLRTLEEYSKTISSDAAAGFERLRYGFYTIEQAVVQTFSARDRLRHVRLYLLVSDRQCPQGLGPVVRAALQEGVDAVQLREKDLPDYRLIDLARRMRDWTCDADALFIVNDRPDIAALVNADGVHVGQEDLSAQEARRIVGGDRLVGVSTHTIEQARQAVLDGADYLGVGPVFPSQTKEFAEFAGLAFVEQMAGETTRPWFALGGITAENVGAVIAAGARRIAVSNAISGSADPAGVARSLANSLAAGHDIEPQDSP